MIYTVTNFFTSFVINLIFINVSVVSLVMVVRILRKVEKTLDKINDSTLGLLTAKKAASNRASDRKLL